MNSREVKLAEKLVKVLGWSEEKVVSTNWVDIMETLIERIDLLERDVYQQLMELRGLRN